MVFYASIGQYLNGEINLGDLLVLLTAKTFKPVARLGFGCLGGLLGWYGFESLGAVAAGTLLGFLVGYDLSTQFHDRLLGDRMLEQGVNPRKQIHLGGIYGRCF